MKIPIVDKIADRIRWGYLTAFILLLISYLLTFQTTQNLLNQAYSVNHTNNVINNLEMVRSSVRSSESSYRGYQLTKDERILNEFYRGPSRVDSLLRILKILINDNNLQKLRLDTLRYYVKDKFDLMFSGLKMFKRNNYQNSDSLIVLDYRCKNIMDSIRALMASMQKEEKTVINGKYGKLSSFSKSIKIINITSLVLAILLTFYSIITFNKENKAKKLADMKSLAFREQLEVRVRELDEANKELVEFRSVEKFAATGRISRSIAHEVRNPLTNINLAAEHLRSEMAENADTNILIEMITRNSNRINQLISDFLNSTKSAQLDFTKVPLNELLDLSLEFAQDRLELKGIKVIKDYSPDICPILADTEKLKIAFLNIIINAVEAMEPDKGVLTIKTEERNGRCVAIISDNGKGISKEHLSRLFEPYFTTKESGTGLGLTNTQNIILGHKASVWVDSEIGKGTTFTISLNYA